MPASLGFTGFYGSSNFLYYGIPEFTAFGDTVCTAKSGALVLMAMFCEVQLSLISCSCEYCSSVTSYLVSSIP